MSNCVKLYFNSLPTRCSVADSLRSMGWSHTNFTFEKSALWNGNFNWMVTVTFADGVNLDVDIKCDEVLGLKEQGGTRG